MSAPPSPGAEEVLPRLAIAIVGCGSAGSRHAHNFAALGCEVTGYDDDPSRTEALARSGAALGADTLEEALRRADAAVIATPPLSHIPLARRAVESGCHVLIEKPLSASLDGVDDLEKEAVAAGLTVAVGLNLRFMPGLRKVRELAASGAVGRLIGGRVEFGYDLRRWRPGTDHLAAHTARAADGGGIVFEAVHELDELLWLGGPAGSVIGWSANSGTLGIDAEDAAAALVKMASGALFEVWLDCLSPVYRRGCTLLGADGRIDWDWPAGRVTHWAAGGEERFEIPSDVDAAYVDEARNFLIASAGRAEPAAGIAEGRESLALALALHRSAASGRWEEPDSGGN